MKTQPTQLQRWYDRLAALAAQTRTRVRAIPAESLVRRSGCTLDDTGSLHLRFWNEPYTVRLSDLTARHANGGSPASDFTQALLLTYLATADGTPPSGTWIAYRDLPDGMFYAQAFRGYAELRLVRELGSGGIAAFRRAMANMGGRCAGIGSGGGSASYSVQVLPRIRLAAVYWLGDEDFPAQASVLFEDTAPHYLPTDGLAVLGSHLVNHILETARR